MIVPYRVLLPDWIFEESNNDQEVQALISNYMQRYPQYSLIRIENNFALCNRINEKN